MLLIEFERRKCTEKNDLAMTVTRLDCFDCLLENKAKLSAHSNTLMENAFSFCCQLCNINNSILKYIYDHNLNILCGLRLRILHLNESDIEHCSIHHACNLRL